MNPMYLTDRNNFTPPNTTPKTKDFFEYRERVADCLMSFGVPLRPAEMATIDYRREILSYFQDKLTAKQAAVMMIDKVRRIYKL